MTQYPQSETAKRDASPLPGYHFSPLACSAWFRLLVAAGISLVLWLAVFWAMHS